LASAARDATGWGVTGENIVRWRLIEKLCQLKRTIRGEKNGKLSTKGEKGTFASSPR